MTDWCGEPGCGCFHSGSPIAQRRTRLKSVLVWDSCPFIGIYGITMRGRNFLFASWSPRLLLVPLPGLICLWYTLALDGLARYLAINDIAWINLLLSCILEQVNFGLTWFAYISQWKNKGRQCRGRRDGGASPGDSEYKEMVTRKWLSCCLISWPIYYLKRVQNSSLNSNGSHPQQQDHLTDIIF